MHHSSFCRLFGFNVYAVSVVKVVSGMHIHHIPIISILKATFVPSQRDNLSQSSMFKKTPFCVQEYITLELVPNSEGL